MNQIQILNKFSNISADEITKVALSALKKLGIEDKIVEVESLDKEGILKLNFEYRGKKEPTDVLSFPLVQFPGENNLLGNIFICEKIARDRKEDLQELVKHGILHLLNYDHETDWNEWEQKAQIINHKM